MLGQVEVYGPRVGFRGTRNGALPNMSIELTRCTEAVNKLKRP